MKISVEKFIKVFDDENGCYYQVGSDADGLDCVEIKYNTGDGFEENTGIVVPPDMAIGIANAMLEIATGIQEKLSKK